MSSKSPKRRVFARKRCVVAVVIGIVLTVVIVRNSLVAQRERERDVAWMVREAGGSYSTTFILPELVMEMFQLRGNGLFYRITRINFSPGWRPKHLKGLDELPRLTALGFWSCPELTDRTLPAISKLSKIEQLSFLYTDITAAGLASLRGMKSLRVLRLAGRNLDQQSIEPIRRLMPDVQIYLEEGAELEDLVSDLMSSDPSAFQFALPAAPELYMPHPSLPIAKPPALVPVESERLVRVRFITPGTGAPDPSLSGFPWVRTWEFRPGQRNRTYSEPRRPIYQGVLEFLIRPPAQFEIQPRGINDNGVEGFWFKDVDKKVDKLGDPLEIDVPVKITGSVSGTFVGLKSVPIEPGTSWTRAEARIVRIDSVPLSQAIRDSDRFKASADQRAKKDGTLDVDFIAHALPIGGTYRVMARYGSAVALSDPFRVAAVNSSPWVKVVFPKGIDLVGQVTDSNGEPIRDARVVLLYYHQRYGTIEFSVGSSGMTQADAQGAYRFRQVNPNVEGRYIVVVRSNPGQPPLIREVDRLSTPLNLITPKNRRFAGIVVDARTRKPVPGVRVGLYPIRQVPFSPDRIPKIASWLRVNLAGYRQWQSDNDDQGRFILDALLDEPYKVVVWGAELISPKTVQGSTEGVEIRVVPDSN